MRRFWSEGSGQRMSHGCTRSRSTTASCSSVLLPHHMHMQENGIKQEWALAPEGRRQAEEAGQVPGIGPSHPLLNDIFNAVPILPSCDTIHDFAPLLLASVALQDAAAQGARCCEGWGGQPAGVLLAFQPHRGDGDAGCREGGPDGSHGQVPGQPVSGYNWGQFSCHLSSDEIVLTLFRARYNTCPEQTTDALVERDFGSEKEGQPYAGEASCGPSVWPVLRYFFYFMSHQVLAACIPD